MCGPGITYDIHAIGFKCSDCNRNAPSKAELCSEPANTSSTYFEMVFADYFICVGHHYLVVGDHHLSGWSEILATPAGTVISAGARGLNSCLRKLFATFSVPAEHSSDGGPEFTSSVTAEFFPHMECETPDLISVQMDELKWLLSQQSGYYGVISVPQVD